MRMWAAKRALTLSAGMAFWASASALAQDSQPADSGVRYRLEQRDAPVAMRIHVLELDLDRVSLEVAAGDTAQGREFVAQTTSAYAQTQGLAAAVNGGYFTPFNGGSRGGDDYYPHAGDAVDVSGTSIAFGVVASPVELSEDERVNSVICVERSGTLIRDGQTCAADVVHAVAAGPRLLAGGERRSFDAYGARYAQARHPRTAVGFDADTAAAWLVVVDGRQAGFSEGATLEELTEIFLQLGAEDAINLDGGGSSTMVIAEDGAWRVVNSPIHTGVPGRERPAANHLGVRRAAAQP
jgi:exopolysaccharide biosynthesis protein